MRKKAAKRVLRGSNKEYLHEAMFVSSVVCVIFGITAFDLAWMNALELIPISILIFAGLTGAILRFLPSRIEIHEDAFFIFDSAGSYCFMWAGTGPFHVWNDGKHDIVIFDYPPSRTRTAYRVAVSQMVNRATDEVPNALNRTRLPLLRRYTAPETASMMNEHRKNALCSIQNA